MPVLLERPKMSLGMWAALKTHIMKQREKKKQEREADATVERLQREQEMKRKRDAMTLEEIKDQLCHLEKKLSHLGDEKHHLFRDLKRVLNEDDKRRNEEDKEQKYEKNDLIQMNHHYPNQRIHIGAPNLYMIAGNNIMNRNPVMYKVGANPQQNGISSGTLKRQRSPSPPNPVYPQGYGYKAHVGAYGQSYPIPHSGGQYTQQDQAKHLTSSYHMPHMQQGYIGQMDHSGQKTNMQEEKYYIQQTGGISTGYPVRGQPQVPSRFQPPTLHAVTTSLQVPIRKEDIMRRSLGNETRR